MILNHKLPVVVVHRGYKDYLKINLEITGKYNKIYLIGDSSLVHLNELNNVNFVDIDRYTSSEFIKRLKRDFMNYSSNSAHFEWGCFERIFILKCFFEEFNFNHVFFMDSDNILLCDINTYPFEKDIAYCLNTNYHKYRMSNSVHVSLLTHLFCVKFTELYEDIYTNKNKLHLIQDKINYHTNDRGNYINGGICDMTLYYILADKNIIDVENLLVPKKGKVFINNINNGEGYESKNQYKTNQYNKIDISFTKDSAFIFDNQTQSTVELLNIHFQGSSKRFLNTKLKNMLLGEPSSVQTQYCS